jgi:hypothetical protein
MVFEEGFMRRRLLSCVALLIGSVFFVATSQDFPTVMKTVDYPQSITLNPINPTQTLTVSSSGLAMDILNFRIEGTHNGNSSGVLTLESQSEISGEDMEGSKSVQIRGGFADQPADFSKELTFEIYGSDPYSSEYVFTWEGETEITFNLTIESMSFGEESEENPFSLEVQ